MSLFNKPKRNIRRRNPDDEDENDNKSADVDQPISRKDKTKKKEKPKQTLLSFGEELDEADDGEVFKVKKSSRSRRLMKLLDQERKRKKDDMKIQMTSDLFTESKIAEKDVEIKTDDLVSKLKHPSSFSLNDKTAVFTGKNDYSSEEETEKTGEISSNFQDKSPKSSNMKFILQSGFIPDAAMIHAARKRRQKAREQGQDYIQIEEQSDEVKGSIIIGEKNCDRSDDDDEERINMNVNTDSLDKERRRQAFLNAQVSTVTISDEENTPDDEWEKQQIKKGVTSTQLSANQDTLVQYKTKGLNQMLDSVCFNNTPAAPPPPVIQRPDVSRCVYVTANDVLRRMRERLSNLREVHRRHEINYEAVVEELSKGRIELTEGKLQAPEVANRYKYYQELRGYVSDLVECLNEKLPIITVLETEWIDLHSERSNFLIERRRQDIRDQAEEITNLARGYIGRRGIEDDARIKRATEREGRRARRRKNRELASVLHRHLDGMSSDDEVTEQQNLIFRQSKEKIEEEVQGIFLDVKEDFCNTKNILSKFKIWKSNDLESYTEAYVPICIPKIISPIVRLQLITWNPLIDSTDFESLNWFNSLLWYTINDSESSSLSDPDLRLIPLTIEKIIIPKLSTIVDKMWDPMSTSQTLRLIGLISRLMKEYPALNRSSYQINTLYDTVLSKMKKAIEKDVFIPIFSKQIMDPKHNFFQRQFTMAIKLLRNLLSWQNLLEDEELKSIALMTLLNEYLLAALKILSPVEALIKANVVMSTIPRVWLQGETIEHLKNFGILVRDLSNRLDQSNPANSEAWEYSKSILKVIKPL